MARQEFGSLVQGGLLPQVENLVVESHRKLYLAEGREWSRPIAYRWLRYEDPMPVARLVNGVKRLRKRGAKLDFDAVEKACAKASKKGYLI